MNFASSKTKPNATSTAKHICDLVPHFDVETHGGTDNN
jgi:hypothetical protein